MRNRFTQFDPFEDTERRDEPWAGGLRAGVSPNSIRSRILKATGMLIIFAEQGCFTQFDPFEDTESR